ncbi:MAG: iron-sulfur cluster assembly scaffold protein [Pseudomonadota bacterium]
MAKDEEHIKVPVDSEEALEEVRRRYGDKVLANALKPAHYGEIDSPDGYAKISEHCGDTIEVFLKVRGGKVLDAGFVTDGCMTTVAALNAALNVVKGKDLKQARWITREEVLEELGGLPREDEHCAGLAASTVRAAAIDCEKMQSEPWKKAYRKL